MPEVRVQLSDEQVELIRERDDGWTVAECDGVIDAVELAVREQLPPPIKVGDKVRSTWLPNEWVYEVRGRVSEQVDELSEPDPVERALSLLVQASRVSSLLRDAVATVENEIRSLRSVLAEIVIAWDAGGDWIRADFDAAIDAARPLVGGDR